jgi:hypothetical protein
MADLLMQLLNSRVAGFMVTVVVCLAYFALMLTTRWLIIARADRMLIQEHLDKLDAELATYAERPDDAGILLGVRKLIAAATAKMRERGALYVLFWGGAYEDSAWYNIHDAKLLLTSLWTWPQLKARLISASSELRTREGGRKAEAQVLAREVDALLKKAGGEPPRKQLEEARGLLQRALRVLYSMEGESDQKTRTWHNRITWLCICSLGLICLLAGAFGNAALFLMGATGGFLSRLSQIRTSKGIATGYGVYWTTLFSSPLIGALAGWTGVLVSSVLVDYQVLGSGFGKITWTSADTPLPTASMVAALFLGFSERLFNSILTRSPAEAPKPSGEAPTQQAPPQQPPSQQAPQAGGTPQPACGQPHA